MIKITLFASLLFLPFSDSIEFINPGEVLKKGEELIADGEYQKAIDLYLQISENDTSYIEFQSELMSLYNTIDEYDQSIAIGLSLKDKPSKFRNSIYLRLGNAYFNSKNYEKSLQIYSEGLTLYPYDHVLIYSVGNSFKELGKYEEALPYFQRSASINPYFSNNHIMLGYLSFLQGHTTKALLSYLMFLAIHPEYKSTLVFLENLVNQAVRDEGSIDEFVSNKDFLQYDQLIHSKAALDPRFHQKVDINASIIKQSELIFSKLQFDEKSDDFWMKFYVPFYIKLYQEDLYPAFLYHVLQSTENEVVTEWISKHEKENGEWISLANNVLSANRVKNETTLLGEKQFYTYWYYDNNDLNAIGNEQDDETRIGPWAFFYPNGQLRVTGRYNDQGFKTGEWRYYHENGIRQRKEVYDEKGNYAEPVEYYHENGALSIIARFNDENEVDGPLEYYFDCGMIRESRPFENGITSGNGKHYFETGTVKSTYQMKEGKLEGTYIDYFKNGKKRAQYNYKDDLTEGPYVSYYINGTVDEQGDYLNDKVNGEWIGYHPNGKISYKGNLMKGKKTGRWERFYANGQLKEIAHYNDSSELHGEFTSYTEDGKLYYIFNYENDKLLEYTMYNPDGSVIVHQSDPAGNMEYQTYFTNGKLASEGTLKDGKLNGPITILFENGNPWKKGTLIDNEYDGEYLEYYPTGEIFQKVNYKNGVREGAFYQYYKNGQIEQQGQYVNDEPEQQWVNYFPDGTKDEENYYINGELNGWVTAFATDNKKQEDYFYDQGELLALKQYDTLGNVYHELEIPHANGIQALLSVSGDTIHKVMMTCNYFNSGNTTYFPGGQLKHYSTREDGLLQGDYKIFRPDGSLYFHGYYNDDMADSIWKWYYHNGNIELKRRFEWDEKNGPSESYYFNGNLESRVFYEDGEEQGPSYFYDQFGNLQIIKLYDKKYGVIGYINSKSKDTIQFKSTGKFEIKSYFPNGKIAVIQNYLDGKYNGAVVWYNQDGSVSEEQNYHHGELNGKRVTYFPNGNIFMETEYKDNLKNGIEKAYYESGQLRRFTYFRNDNKNGYEIIYNENGSVDSKIFYWNDQVY